MACMYLDGELDVWVGSNLLEVIGPGGIIGEMALIEKEHAQCHSRSKVDLSTGPC